MANYSTSPYSADVIARVSALQDQISLAANRYGISQEALAGALAQEFTNQQAGGWNELTRIIRLAQAVVA